MLEMPQKETFNPNITIRKKDLLKLLVLNQVMLTILALKYNVGEEDMYKECLKMTEDKLKDFSDKEINKSINNLIG